ncbi:MAG: hypothetical protein WBM24_13735 [Candidatus Sulfotelmatobacter sp.]
MKNHLNSDPKRELLRHGLATLAYRGGKAIRNAPPAFADFNTSEGVRSPGKILAHIGDLLDWGLSIAAGKQTWKDSKPLPWEKESERFFEALKRFDEYLESSEPLHATPEKLLQGPVADALTHVGQIAMLRRMAGGPVRGESYFEAQVTIGRVGVEQTPPKREF